MSLALDPAMTLEAEVLSVGKKPDPYKEKPLFIRLPARYHEALKALAKKGRRHLTEEAKIAFEAHFIKHGIWSEDDIEEAE